MKLAAALILTLASPVALADQPYAGSVSQTEDGNRVLGDVAYHPIRQPISGYQGHTSELVDDMPPVVQATQLINGQGDDWSMWQRSGVAPAENGYEADTDMDASDLVRSPNQINEWLQNGDRN